MSIWQTLRLTIAYIVTACGLYLFALFAHGVLSTVWVFEDSLGSRYNSAHTFSLMFSVCLFFISAGFTLSLKSVISKKHFRLLLMPLVVSLATLVGGITLAVILANMNQ